MGEIKPTEGLLDMPRGRLWDVFRLFQAVLTVGCGRFCARFANFTLFSAVFCVFFGRSYLISGTLRARLPLISHSFCQFYAFSAVFCVFFGRSYLISGTLRARLRPSLRRFRASLRWFRRFWRSFRAELPYFRHSSRLVAAEFAPVSGEFALVSAVLAFFSAARRAEVSISLMRLS